MLRTASILAVLSVLGAAAFAGDGKMKIENRDELTRMINMFDVMKEGRMIDLHSKQNARRVIDSYLASTDNSN